MRVTISCIFALAVSWLTASPLVAQQTAPRGQATQGFLQDHLADYAAQLRGPNRRIDTDAMVKRLKELDVTTYYWLIGYGRRDWEDLQEFLPKAAAAGIDVWAYLLPPSESGPQGGGSYSEPFRLDYVRWAEELARLSLKQPNLKAWVIDDFCQNLSLFTPDYLGRMQTAAKRLNPNFRFLPLLYFHDIEQPFLNDYRPVIDGVVVAYPRGRRDIDAAWAVLNDVCNMRPGQISLGTPVGTRAGDFGGASQQATVLNSPTYRIRFQQCEQYTGATAGYHFKQLLVDGVVVWDEDVADGSPGWQEVDVDVTKQVRGKPHVNVGFRIYDKKGVGVFPIRWTLRNLRPKGYGLSGSISRRNGPPIVGAASRSASEQVSSRANGGSTSRLWS